MYGIIRILEYFATISLLRINFSKTEIIVWMGCKFFLKEVFHYKRWKLDWNNRTFDLLGIKFCTDLHDMIDLNYKTKLDEIKKTMIQ